MADDFSTIPMDDPAVREVLGDLESVITQKQRDAFQRSISVRGLVVWWVEMFERAQRQKPSHILRCMPTVGMKWCDWIETLKPHDLILVASTILAEAGVLGTRWSADARYAVWCTKGWS